MGEHYFFSLICEAQSQTQYISFYILGVKYNIPESFFLCLYHFVWARLQYLHTELLSDAYIYLHLALCDYSSTSIKTYTWNDFVDRV